MKYQHDIIHFPSNMVINESIFGYEIVMISNANQS